MVFNGQYVVVPPAPGRVWLNDLPVAEAPEELKRIVLGVNALGMMDMAGGIPLRTLCPTQVGPTASTTQISLLQSSPCNAVSKASLPTLCGDDP